MTNNEEELVLIGRLKSMDSDLFSDLQDIEKFCEGVWKSKLLPWFTNHNPDHSRELIFILDQLLTPLEGGKAFLTKHELFVLLASAYLHDIGMQFLKWEDIPIDKLTEKEYDEVRKKHAKLSSEIILKRVAKSVDRDDFHLPARIDDEYIAPIAFVCKGHSSEYFAEVMEKFRDSPYSPKGRPLRGVLLAALLLIADELDLQCKRIDFKETAKFDLSLHTQVHWYKHHYVEHVEISRNAIKITLRYPSDSDDYEPLVKELIETKLVQQIKRVNPYLREGTQGVLVLDDQVEFNTIIDGVSGKRSLPPDVLTELKRLLRKISQPPLRDPDVTPGCASIPEPTELFTGMEQKKTEFRDLLAKANLISVEGLGGVGKTEFVLKYIEQFLPKEKVVWFECLPDSKVDALIGLSGYPEVLKGENKTELGKYSGFIDLIEKDEKTLFLDNFQSITGNSFEEWLKFTERRLKKARVILVSREHPSFSVKFVPIELHGLGDEALWYAQRFKEAYYGTLQVSEGNLKDICSTLEGHPLAIELALQLLSYGESPKNIIQRIVRAEDKSRELSDRLLDDVFNHPKSTEEEKEFLLRFSLFRTEIDREGMSSLFDGEAVSSTLYKLIDKKMVSVANGLYRTHPLIREFCYQRLSDKDAAHEKAALYFETRRTDRFDPFLEEEIFYHIFNSKNRGRTADFISETGSKFILLGHTNSLIEMINKAQAWGLDRSAYQVFLGDIATSRGEWDGASKHFEEAFSSKDVDDRITAEAYIKFGEILYRKGEVRGALKYFEDAHARCKRYGFKKEEGRSANDIGLVFKTFGDWQEAEQWLRDGQDVRKAIGDKEGIAISLNNIGSVFHDQGNLPGALQKHKESLKIREEIGDKSGIAGSLNNIGSVLQVQGNLPGALQKYKESLKIFEEIREKPGIATSLNNIGSVLDAQGNLPGALQKCKESLKIREEIGDRLGIAGSLNNIGGIWRSKKNYSAALECFLKSFALRDRIGVDKNTTAGLIAQIRRELGLKKFRKIFQVVYDSLAKDLQTHVHLEEFTEDKKRVVRGSEKVGRNDPCPCGSGKKYKKCCGK